MRARFRDSTQTIHPLVAGALLSLLLAGCASAPERMTQAALKGDTTKLSGLLKGGSKEINTPVTLDEAAPACPGLKVVTPLQAAACAGQTVAMAKLLEGKADINLATGAGRAPLLLAIANNRDDAARVLIESGAGLEVTDAAGNTPLLLAVAKGNRPIAEDLLRHGASAKARNRAGETALLLSTDAGLSKKLVALGADPLAVTAEGLSGLHLAAVNGDAASARFFLERGVDVGLRNRHGATALDIARAATATANAQSDRMAALIQLRGLPASGASRMRATAVTPELAAGRAEVATVIVSWIEQSVQQTVAVADRAAEEGRSAEALALYAAALDKTVGIQGAGENALRTKIIGYALSLPEAPALPEQAREHLVRSNYLLKKGQDISLVEGEISAALRDAPWWVEGYYNLGQLQAEQGKFDAAERNLKLFIAAAGADARAQAAQDKIYEIRMGREEEAKIRGMQGRWVDTAGRGYSTTVNGDKIHLRSDGGLSFTLTQRNGMLEGTVEGGSYAGEHSCTIPAQMHPVTGRMSADARSINLDYLWSRYKTSYHCVNMAGVPSNCCLLCSEVCDAVTVSGSDRTSLQLRPAQ